MTKYDLDPAKVDAFVDLLLEPCVVIACPSIDHMDPAANIYQPSWLLPIPHDQVHAVELLPYFLYASNDFFDLCFAWVAPA